MKKAPIPENEDARICAVLGLNIINTEKDEQFDQLTSEACAVFKVPISTISIIDSDREWYKSHQGIEESDGPRDISFCGHALLQKDILIIEDTTKDPDFRDNPYVLRQTNPIRFYAGKSLFSFKEKLAVGVFCIKDYKPRTMNLREIEQFLELALRAEKLINEKVVK